MIHDKFCPCGWSDASCGGIDPNCVHCKCFDILEIRADEKERAAQRIKSVKACYSVAHSSHDDHLGWDMFCRGHLIAAARGEDEK